MSKLLDQIKQAVSQHSLEELSTEMLASYKKKAGEQASEADKKGDFKKGNKRFSGIMKATRKQFDNDAKNESVEPIEELSKKTLMSYIKKATKSKNSANREEGILLKHHDRLGKEARNLDYKYGDKEGAQEKYREQGATEEKMNVAGNTVMKRSDGIWRAKSRLAKEEVEALEELSKKTLSSYHAKASVDSYDQSRKALDAFSAGDKEKDDYHFKKMNQREIGKIRAAKKGGVITTNEEGKEITPREKDLAAAAHPKDKITHKDVLVKRGVLKAESVDGPNLPPETEIWQKMNPYQKAKVMEKVGSKGSVPKTHRACMDHIRKNMDHYKKQLDESVSAGDKVVVQTANGKQEGVVNDVTNTHVGVRHPGIKGVIHYHAEYVKKKIAEEVDETLIEGVSWERWDRSHKGVKGMSKSNRGGWVASKHSSGYKYGHKEGEDHITVNGTGKEAAKKASDWAKSKGHDTVYMLEAFTPENVKNDIPFGAIVNSALTTVMK